MEDEVERLLARTRARREALNSRLRSIGEGTKDVRSPLKEKNTNKYFRRAASPEFRSRSPIKSPTKIEKTITKSSSSSSSSPDLKSQDSNTKKIISEALGKSPESSKETFNRETTETKMTITEDPKIEGNTETYTTTTITEKEEKIEKTEVLKFKGFGDSTKAAEVIKKLAFNEETESKEMPVRSEVKINLSPKKIKEKAPPKPVFEKVNEIKDPEPLARSEIKSSKSAFDDENEIKNRHPIIRSEIKLPVENDGKVNPTGLLDEDNASARKKRLAGLAQKFANWEDDTKIGHAIAAATANSAKLNVTSEIVDVDEEVEHYSNVAGKNRNVISDPSFIDSLKAQGFQETTSKSRLVYDFSKSPSRGRSPTKKHPTVVSKSPVRSTITPRAVSPHKPHPLQFVSPQKANEIGPPKPVRTFQQSQKPQQSDLPLQTWRTETTVRVASPVKTQNELTDTASRRSILEKRSIFEETQSPKAIDPALLPVSARKAIFEKNKSSAPKPIARLGESVTPAMLSKSKTNSDTATPDVRPPRLLAASEPVWKRKREPSPPVQIPRSPETEVKRRIHSPRKIPDGNIPSFVKPVRSPVRSPSKPPLDATRSAKVESHRRLFENVNPDWRKNEIAKKTEEAKQRDMELLLNRFAHQKKVLAEEEKREENKIELKKENFKSPTKVNNILYPSPNKEALDNYPGVNSLKRIKVSPPKPGNLYPNISDPYSSSEEQSSRPETAMSEESLAPSEAISEAVSETPSLGTAIKRVATTAPSVRPGMPAISEDSPDREMEVSMQSEDIGDVIDEALDDSELAFSEDGGPTPPKMARESPQRSSFQAISAAKSPTTSTSSWEFHTPSNRMTRPTPTQDFKTPLIETEAGNSPGLSALPEVEGIKSGEKLLHSISIYRRERPTATIVRNEKPFKEDELKKRQSEMISLETIRHQIRKLQEEAREQEQRMEQASKALNYCVSKDEFEGSFERVEGERLLLEATHKYSAAMAEIQRLKTEGAVGKATPQKNRPLDCKGAVSISGITLPLKSEFVKMMENGDLDFVHYFVCLVKFKNQVIATQMLSSIDGITRGKLVFPNLINLRDLDFDFEIHLEVYGLQTRKEFLTHEAKYHIRKEKSMFNLTPLKLLRKQESRYVGPRHQNPVNSKTIRRPSFGRVGHIVINIDTIRRKNLVLQDVPEVSPLQGAIFMNLTVHSENRIEHRGFLTVFNDVNGLGDWSRRWCLLSGNTLRFWKYPEDEAKTKANAEILLNHCVTETVTLAPKEVCSRMNTFLLETQRQTRPEDRDSLVTHVNRKSGLTKTRHLLMADTRDERIAWCNILNGALENLRAWDPSFNRPRSGSVSSQASSVSTTTSVSSESSSSASTEIW